MRRSRFTEEQIIGILKQHQAGLGAKELCRKHGISDATFYKWRSRFGGMEVSDARKLKALEEEKRREAACAISKMNLDSVHIANVAGVDVLISGTVLGVRYAV